MNNQNQQNNQAQFPPKQSGLANQNKGLFSLPPARMQFVPWIPLMLEATTGQKIPAMTGTLAEIQQGIQQIQISQAQIIQIQQQLDQRLTQLENNATNQFTNLAQQVQSIKSIRLSHSRETKQLDYNFDKENETQN